ADLVPPGVVEPGDRGAARPALREVIEECSHGPAADQQRPHPKPQEVRPVDDQDVAEIAHRIVEDVEIGPRAVELPENAGGRPRLLLAEVVDHQTARTTFERQYGDGSPLYRRFPGRIEAAQSKTE